MRERFRKLEAGKREKEDPKDWATLVRQYLVQRQDRYLAEVMGLVKQEADVCADLETEGMLRKLVRLLVAFGEQDWQTVLALSQEIVCPRPMKS
jgi:hypothetical protein